MTVEQNAANYRRWMEEGWGQGRVELLDELYAPGYVTHAMSPDLPPNAEGLKTFLLAIRTGVPDLTCTVHELAAEGDRVAGRLTLRGTHAGTLLGIPATGRKVDVGVMVLARFDDAARWIEDWASWDQLGMLQQIGVVPAPAAH